MDPYFGEMYPYYKRYSSWLKLQSENYKEICIKNTSGKY
jgi:hypothetical protein